MEDIVRRKKTKHVTSDANKNWMMAMHGSPKSLSNRGQSLGYYDPR